MAKNQPIGKVDKDNETDNQFNSSRSEEQGAQKTSARKPAPARVLKKVDIAALAAETERKRAPARRNPAQLEAPLLQGLPGGKSSDIETSKAASVAVPSSIQVLGSDAVAHYRAQLADGKTLKAAARKTELWAKNSVPPKEVQELGKAACDRWHQLIGADVPPDSATRCVLSLPPTTAKVPFSVRAMGSTCAEEYQQAIDSGTPARQAEEEAIMGELLRLKGNDNQAAMDAYQFEQDMQGEQALLKRYLEELDKAAADKDGDKEDRDSLSLGVNLEFLSNVLRYPLALGLDFCFDNFSQLTCFRLPVNQFGESGTGKGRLIGWGPWHPMEDHIVTRLRKSIASCTGVQPTKTELKDVLDLHGKDNRRDLLIDWCNALEWDQVPRCEKLLTDYFPAIGAPDFLRKASLTFTTALAARALKPGYKFDMALALSSSQGYRKTSSLNALAPMDPDTTFITLTMDAPQAELNRFLRDSVIIEIGEADKMSKPELKKFKNVMSAAKTRQRQLYKEGLSKMSFRYVMMATTNEDEFLTDPTGARRWVCFKLKGVCDVAAVRRDRDQIWAEAVHLVRQAGGEVLHYAETEAYAAKGNEEFQIDDSDVWEAAVLDWLDDHDADDSLTPNAAPLTASLILSSALNKPLDRQTHSDKMRVNKIMKALGYAQVNAKVKGTTVRKYFKV